MRAATIVAMALLLTACHHGAKSDWSALARNAIAVQEECRNKRLAGELPDRAASVRCATPRVLELYRAAHYPYMDLIELARAQMLVIAERRDRDQISDAEEGAALAELNTRITGELDRRVTSSATRAAAIHATMPVICNTFGNTTIC